MKILYTPVTEWYIGVSRYDGFIVGLTKSAINDLATKITSRRHSSRSWRVDLNDIRVEDLDDDSLIDQLQRGAIWVTQHQYKKLSEK